MTKALRKQVYNKFNGRCAYTGKPLPNDWQVDHILPQRIFDVVMSDLAKGERWVSQFKRLYNTECIEKDDIRNLLPALKIVNHYKRDFNLEGFRAYMKDFHIRLSKLPKKPRTERSIKRIKYMNEVAKAFNITPDKPFSGVFYFEKNNK